MMKNKKLFYGSLFALIIVAVSIFLFLENTVKRNTNTQQNDITQKSQIGKDYLTSKLTSGKWTYYVGGGKFTYTFNSDGTYINKYVSDYTDKTEGKWHLTEDESKRMHLILEEETGQCYWLPCDSIINYDNKNDLLLISGPSIKGVQPLRHD